MSKRKFEPDLEDEVEDNWKDKPLKPESHKHSLDSDEDDDEVDEEKYKILEQDDIEGQEEGGVRQEGDVQITPFNMDEELEDGHFDTDGNFHWKKEKLVKDHWLDNIDWVKIRKEDENAPKKSTAESDDSESDEEPFDSVAVYKKILLLMKPKETVAGALRRLGGTKSMSASERWKKKKAGYVEEENPDKQNCSLLTELANELLTRLGNMDIYQETYEQISKLVSKGEKKKGSSIYADASNDDLDMYADDFAEKEKVKIFKVPEIPKASDSPGQSSSEQQTSSNSDQSSSSCQEVSSNMVT